MPTTRANGSARRAIARTQSAKLSPASTAKQNTSKKRAAGDDYTESTPKKKRSSAKERSANDPYNPENNLVDSLRPGLILVMCGLNPGLQTALTGTLGSQGLFGLD